jgi:hypothetical protein
MDADRVVERPTEEEEKQNQSRFNIFKRSKSSEAGKPKQGPRPPSSFGFPDKKSASKSVAVDDDLPEREEHPTAVPHSPHPQPEEAKQERSGPASEEAQLPARAGFDFGAIQTLLAQNKKDDGLTPTAPAITTTSLPVPPISPIARTESAPLPEPTAKQFQPTFHQRSDSEYSSSTEDSPHKRSQSLDSVRDPSTARESTFSWSTSTSFAESSNQSESLTFGSTNGSVWQTDSTSWAPEPSRSHESLSNRVSALDIGSTGGARASLEDTWSTKPPVSRKDTLSLNPWGD